MTKRPVLSLDLFDDEAIREPYSRYQAIRDEAPGVWLEAHNVWALGRYHAVRDALRADHVLVSGRGVALNDILNGQQGTTTLMSDGDLHRRRRGVLMKPMMPSALAEVRKRVEELSAKLVEDLLERPAFDGIADFSRHLPVAIVSHLVGLPEEGRESMLDWAAAGFNALGPWNERAQSGAPLLGEMVEYALRVDRTRLDPDGWAARIFDAVDDGRLAPEDAPGLLVDYIAPSLDTTLLATGHLLYLLGTHPEQYEKVRDNPDLVPGAVNEALRLGSPVKGFSRVAVETYNVEGISIPEGERVLILYGAANRDERHYPDPTRFDVTRSARDHLAFGHGVHRCAGGHLAQLEMEELVRAMIARVRRIEVAEPEPLMSNMLHGHASFRASFSGA